MAITLPSYGTEVYRDKVWYSNLIVNPVGILPPAELFDLDPTLPYQGTQPHPDNVDLHYVVIPRGRIVGAIQRQMTATGKPQLTFADGKDIAPVGYAPENIFAKIPHRIIPDPRFERSGYIEVPYIEAVNAAYGTLKEGDYVSAYFGSTTSTTLQAAEDIGKPVKWVERAVYRESAFASGAISLSSANLPGITPRLLFADNAGTLVTGSVTLAWNTTLNKWVATAAAGNMTSVVYDFGQSVNHRAAQIIRLKQVSATQEADGWLRWVEQDFSSYLYPPMVYDFRTTAVTAETPSLVSGTDATFNLANGKIAPHKEITVRVTGAIMNNEGTLTQYADGVDLSVRTSTVFDNYAVGDYYRVDFIRGILYLSDNVRNTDGTQISASNIRVSYNYMADYESGRTTITGYGVGIRGMTDGFWTGLPGTPIHLERAAADRRFVTTAGHFGAMRLMFG